MNIDVARKIVESLQIQYETISREALAVALDELEIALTDDPAPATLQVNVTDLIDLAGDLK